MEEIWLDIKDFEGLYQVSNYGRVKSLNYRNTGREEILKLTKLKSGHLCANLGRTNLKLIHILVAEHFISNPDKKEIVHHIDGNPENNRTDNLMWVTKPEHAALHPEWGNPKPINQYDLDGNFIKKWKSASTAAKELGFIQSHINECCNGGFFSKSRNKWVNITQYKGSIWKYADEDN